jgi:acyl-CoA hydrolase
MCRQLEPTILCDRICWRVRFYRPMLIGNVVEVQARLLYTGRTTCISQCMCVRVISRLHNPF